MCGITGFLGGFNGDVESTIRRMTQSLNHRGPNDSGVWVKSDSLVALGHSRLAIIDLSTTGRQPMISSSGRYVVVFNGEIYNHSNLRVDIERSGRPFSWRGCSDTEVLLASFEVWGVQGTSERAIGMFAFAVWDNQTNTLQLVRDRLGEKPLYYGWQGSGANKTFLFGSELKSFKAHPLFSKKVDRNSLALLMRHSFIPAPYSIYENIFKLEPGSILSVSLSNEEPVIIKYWDIINVAISGKAIPFEGSAEQAVDKLELLVKAAVKQQMVADVPLGAFLSGGIDSSTVTALMQSQSSSPIKTFTIGFNDDSFNEARYAKAIATHLGTDHTELYITPNEVFDILEKLPLLYCEPFADSSQIPSYLISQLAKHQVTVSLSGDGGDELFCGYNRYSLSAKLWKKLAHIPAPLRGLASRLITSFSPSAWDEWHRIILGRKIYSAFGDKVHKGASVLTSLNFQELYLGLVSQIQNPNEWVIGGNEPPTKFNCKSSSLDKFSDIERMMLLDTIIYLPDDILVKFDRASMGVSLEGRVPLLDHRIVEFAWTLPLDYKLRNRQTKWLLRELLYRYVPKELIERPKMGFAVPIGSWLRGPFRSWAEALLSENRLKKEGYFHPGIIRSKWAEHLSGRRNWQSQLWTVLMFQVWLENEK